MGVIYREGNVIGNSRSSSVSAANGLWNIQELEERRRRNIWPSQDIVTAGLVVNLDASKTQSYPGSGTSWTNLAGASYNGTLVNGPTYSSNNYGIISFDGTNDHVNFPSASLSGAGTTAMSCFMWVYVRSDGVLLTVQNTTAILTSYYHSAIEVGSGGQLRMSLWHNGLTNRVNSTISFNTWNNIGFTYSGTTLTGYLNGSSVGTASFTWSKPSTIFFGIMASASATNMGTNAYGHGDLGTFYTYNTSLTSEQVSQNFSALRNRYGV